MRYLLLVVFVIFFFFLKFSLYVGKVRNWLLRMLLVYSISLKAELDLRL